MASQVIGAHWSDADLAVLAAGVGPDGRRLPASGWMAVRRLGWGAVAPAGVVVSEGPLSGTAEGRTVVEGRQDDPAHLRQTLGDYAAPTTTGDGHIEPSRYSPDDPTDPSSTSPMSGSAAAPSSQGSSTSTNEQHEGPAHHW
ncbi:hypothetical protein [Micromonospora coerulea]|uniref:hypothetical protein n=1 Tax=Micromonospora coerulea TaxID=47856 RepID=UPI001F20C5D2|nr:hypothetical protein [Micromonospora veneta]